MIEYDLGSGVNAFTTERGDNLPSGVVTPLRQAHSTKVVRIPCEDPELIDIDALVTDCPGLTIGVRTADCVPILLYDPERRVVAAVHSGWKGTVGNIIAETVAMMQQAFSTCPSDVIAAIGPCIHLDAFEVGDEVYERFVEARYEKFCRRIPVASAGNDVSTEKWHIDLPEVCRHQLQSLGVSRIEISPCCTFANADRFYSYRREGASLGSLRHLNCIALKPE